MLAAVAVTFVHDDPAAALAAFTEVLRSDGSAARRVAMNALRYLPGEEAERLLLAALDDPDQGVRVLAFDSIRGRYRLQAYETRGGLLNRLALRLHSSFSALRTAAIAELRQLLAALRDGRSPADLGLAAPMPGPAAALARLLQSFRTDPGEAPFAEDFDLDALDALDAEARAWAELALLSAFEGGDPRAARALAHMRSTLARELGIL